MAHTINLAFFRGEDVILRGTMDPIPVGGIAGWALTMTLRATADAVGEVFNKSVGSGITILADLADDPEGTPVQYKMEIAIADTDTTGETPGLFAWDVKRTDAGKEAVLVSGTILLKQEVTR